jgi:hypothetical protein
LPNSGAPLSFFARTELVQEGFCAISLLKTVLKNRTGAKNYVDLRKIATHEKACNKMYLDTPCSFLAA